MEYKNYQMMELTLEGAAPEGSHVKVDVNATFTIGDKSTQVAGFYAGNDTYKVRFLPMEEGTYTYQVTGALTQEGTFQVTAGDKDAHGPVRAVDTYLQYEDGSFFYSCGTTIYALAHQDDALTEETFQTLSEAPFNKVRMCVFPKHYNYNINDPKYFPFETFPGKEYHELTLTEGPSMGGLLPTEDISDIWDVNHPCFAFWDAFEEKIVRLGKMGIQVDLILFHPYDRWGFDKQSQEDNMTYLDYVVRRLAAYPNIWWSMANEYDLCGTKTMDDWKKFEAFLTTQDPFHHMLSNHNCFPMYDFSGKGITHCSIQKRAMNLADELMKRYHKPVCYDECAYEGNLKEDWGAISAKEMTNRFWKATATGAYCTHGEVYLDADMENVHEAVLWWAKGGKLHGESPKRIAFLREIMEEIGQPLHPLEEGFGGKMGEIASLPEEQFQGIISTMPEGFRQLIRSIRTMSPLELQRQLDSEWSYGGKTEDDSANLHYYGIDCHARVDISLPEDYKYKIEVIDAWNMTRETVATGVSGKQEVKLPGREYMAVLATRM